MIEYTVKVYDGGNKYWYLNGELHREDGPACEFSDGSKEWYKNGARHREDGPAIECANGDKFWYLNGKEFTEEKFLQMTQKHVIIIDGKDISVSEKSFNELKKSLSSH